jgi:hypothetical protein
MCNACQRWTKCELANQLTAYGSRTGVSTQLKGNSATGYHPELVTIIFQFKTFNSKIGIVPSNCGCKYECCTSPGSEMTELDTDGIIIDKEISMYLGENVSCCHFIHLNNHMDCHWIKPGDPGWEASDSLGQRCTSRAHRTVCEDVCSSACTRANDATARPGM